MRARLLVIAALAFRFATTLSAQTTDTATITGQILDQSRAPMQGVQVTVRNLRNGSVRTGVTDASGRITLGGLPVSGAYRITASKQGFSEVTYPASGESD